MSEVNYKDARFFAGAPTRQQAKDIFWDDLKRYIPKKLLIGSPRETDLVLNLFNGASIHVLGLDKPERAEGHPWNGGVLDEYGNMKKEVWTEHLRPVCLDRNAWVDFIGVPEGRNHYFELAEDSQNPDFADEWAYFHWTTEEILPLYLGEKQARLEIDSAKRDMDTRTYAQEFLGEFTHFTGRIYYNFDRDKHAKYKLSGAYDKAQPLIFCFDFNVSPGVAVVLQELNPIDKISKIPFTAVIGEVHIAKDSTTPQVCQALLERWGGHEGQVICYGDASGGAKGSAKVLGSDWELIKQILRPVYKTRLRFNVPKSNPRIRARINAVNSRMESMEGEVRLLLDPVKAPMTIRDLDMVQADDNGEIEKKDLTLTHLSDGLGYYIANKHPVHGGKRAEVVQV